MEKLRSVGARMMAIIFAVALPLAGAMLYLWWQALEEGRARELALLASRLAQIDRSLADLRDQSAWVMSNMAQRPAFRALQPSACSDEMSVLRNINDAFLAITLWTRDGALVCSSFPPRPGAAAPRPHRPSLEAGLAAGGLYLSDVFKGQITGLDLVTFTYPVRDAAGAIVGLLSMPLRTDYFARLLRFAGMPEHAVAGIADRKLTLVARVPDEAGMLGRSIGSIVEEAVPYGSVPGASVGKGADGVRRLFVRTVVADTGWHAYIGVDEATALSGMRRQLRLGVAAFAIVFALSLTLAYLIGRGITVPIRNLAELADQVAKGDRRKRAGLPAVPELARLAGGFNRMLDSLGEAERATLDREASYRALVESSPDAVLIHQDLRIVFVNEAMVRLLRAADSADLVGRSSVFMLDDASAETARDRSYALYAGGAQPRAEQVYRRLDGSRVDVEIAAAPTQFMGAPAAQVTVRDISPRKEAERLLRGSVARARELSARLMRAEEAERKRIAHDLHDQVGQELTALKIRLETLSRTTASDDERSQARAAAALAGETLQRVRQMSVDLRPPHLDSLGLAAALRAHVERLSGLGSLSLHFDSRECPRVLPPDVEIMCFRVAQEALTNVMRHSAAANAWIEVNARGGALRLSVRDDGRGFDVDRQLSADSAVAGFGLLGMQERVALAGGVLDIRSGVGQGCTVTASFPLPEAA